MKIKRSSIPVQLGGIVERISSDQVVVVGRDENVFYTTIYSLSDWIKQAENRLNKLEGITEADSYKYETKLVKKDKDK